jgi:hypothetical protein
MNILRISVNKNSRRTKTLVRLLMNTSYLMRLSLMICFTSLSFLINFLNAQSANHELFTLRCRDAGLFSMFNDVLAFVKSHEQGFFPSIEVDFDQYGHYYDPKYGRNWWTYYCYPICIGIKDKDTKITEVYVNAWETELHTTREEAFRLIKKYIHIKPHIKEKVNSFQKNYFGDHFVIGVHYRGTDKILEAPIVPYKLVYKEIKKILKKFKKSDFLLFVATDEQLFLDDITRRFPNRVCYNEDAIHSKNGRPVHLDGSHNKYKVGEDAIIDSLLLSKCDILLRTSSNLSLWSTFFNPYISTIELNQRYIDQIP